MRGTHPLLRKGWGTRLRFGSFHLRLKEGEQVSVDLIRQRGAHSVRASRNELELRVLYKLGGESSGISEGHDLVRIAVENQRGTSIFLRSSVKSVSEKALMQS